MEEVKKQKVVEIYPTKLGRRVLCFLSDIFLCLILSFIFFELVVFQISRPIINYDNLVNESETYQKNQYAILYSSDLLFFNDENKENQFMMSEALEDTNYNYLNFYTNDNSEELKKYDVFFNYFVNLKSGDKSDNLNELNGLLIKYGSDFFNTEKTTINGTFALKTTYIEQFKANYIEGDEMSEEAKNNYENFSKKVFLNLYSVMINDIETNDLKVSDVSKSYVELKNDIQAINDKINTNYIVCSYISFLISSLVLFLLVPLINHKRETASELILKFERINKKTMNYISRPMAINIFLLKMIDSALILFLIPSLRVGFSYIFSFPELYLPSLIALVIVIINLFITGFTKLNTSLKEITTDTIVCDSKSLDYYYQQVETEKLNGKWCLWCKKIRRRKRF